MVAAVDAKRRRSELSALRRREELSGYLLLSPWIIGFIVFVLGPVIACFYLSFTRYEIVTPPVFVGAANYRKMFTNDPLFWQALRVTSVYSFVSVPLGLVAGLAIAILLNQGVRGLAVFRTVFYLPAVVSGVAVALMWTWLFNPDLGLVNSLLRNIGIQGPKWFLSPRWALPTLIITSLWGVGGGMVIYLAGLQGVPTALYEAAELDGAGAFSKFLNITIPMISPVIFFNLIMGVIGSFQSFTSAYIITDGGPMNATLFYILYLYRQAFQYYKMGYGSAMAWVLAIIIMLLTLLLFRTAGQQVYYEGALRR